MSDEQLWAAACQSARGLRFLHSHGVLHLDVKPENIYLAAGTWRIGDFGLAVARGNNGSMVRAQRRGQRGACMRWLAGWLAAQGHGCRHVCCPAWRAPDRARLPAPAPAVQDWEEGDGDYVAPELLQAGGEPSPASDIFSLGATLLECATGAVWSSVGGLRGASQQGGAGRCRRRACPHRAVRAAGCRGCVCQCPATPRHRPPWLRRPSRAGRKLPRSEGWTAEDVERLEVPHRPPAFVQLLRAMLQPSPALRPTAHHVLEVVARQQPAVAAAAAEAEAQAEAAAAAQAAAAAAARQSPGMDVPVQQAAAALGPSPFMQHLRAAGGGAAAAAAAEQQLIQAAAAAGSGAFSFDMPQGHHSGFEFTPGQPLRPHNRHRGGGGGPGLPPATAVKGTPVGRARLGGRWAPALSPLISEGALTPGAAAALAGLTPSTRGSSEGAPTPVLGHGSGGSSSGGGGSRRQAVVTPLDAWRPTPLQVPPQTASLAMATGGSSGGVPSVQHPSSGGTQDSQDGWRLSRRDIISPDSDTFNGEAGSPAQGTPRPACGMHGTMPMAVPPTCEHHPCASPPYLFPPSPHTHHPAASQSDSDFSYSCGTGKTMSDMDFADALSPMSQGGCGWRGSGGASVGARQARRHHTPPLAPPMA